MTQRAWSNAISRRSFLARSALTAGAIAGTGALLDACGSGSSKGGTTTVSIMMYDVEFPKAERDAFEKANPDIKLNFIPYDTTKLAALYAARNPPDLVRVLGASDMPGIAARGLAIDLSSYFANSSVIKIDDLQPVNDVFQWDGKTQGQGARYGMTLDWAQDSMFWYNKTLFDQAHVPYPDSSTPLSYDELLELGKRLTVRQGGKIQVYGLNSEWEYYGYGFLQQRLAQQGLSFFSPDLTKADFTTPAALQALRWHVDCVQARVGISVLDPDANWSGVLFPANRVAISMFGYWFGGHIVAPDPKMSIGDTVGIAPAPQQPGGKRVSDCFSATGCYISSSTKNKDAAWKVFEYYLGGPAAIAHAQTGSGIPPLKSLYSQLPKAQPWQKKAFDTVQAELPYTGVLTFSPYINGTALNTAIQNYMGQVAQKRLTLEQGAEQLTSAVNLLLSQGQQVIG